MQQLTTQQQYDKVVATFVSWLNWERETDLGGLLLGLADYYCEIRLLEKELGIPQNKRFDIKAAYGHMWRYEEAA